MVLLKIPQPDSRKLSWVFIMGSRYHTQEFHSNQKNTFLLYKHRWNFPLSCKSPHPPPSVRCPRGRAVRPGRFRHPNRRTRSFRGKVLRFLEATGLCTGTRAFRSGRKQIWGGCLNQCSHIRCCTSLRSKRTTLHGSRSHTRTSRVRRLHFLPETELLL